MEYHHPRPIMIIEGKPNMKGKKNCKGCKNGSCKKHGVYKTLDDLFGTKKKGR